jgi:ABC-2 type transport system permease protein
MNHLTNITKKEMKELLTPGSVISIVVIMVILMSVGTMVGSATEDATSPKKVGIVNGDESGEWSDFAIESLYGFYVNTYGIPYEKAKEYIIFLDSPYGDNTQITAEMMEKNLDTAFGIPSDFTEKINNKTQTKIDEYYIFVNGGLIGTATTTVSATAIPWISSSIALKLTSEATDPDTAVFLLYPIDMRASQSYTYIKGEVYEGVTPIELSSSIFTQTMMIPVVIMMIIIMIGSLIISSMGFEKENKTLETLLTMPVKRTTIVSGKLLASAIVGLIYGLAYMLGMMFYMGGFTSSMGGANPADYGLTLGLVDWVLTGVTIFLALFCALGICMILGAFAKNYKTAQTMTMPISVMAMIPMFVTMFASFNALPAAIQGVMFAIPFTHPMMVMNNLMFGETTLVLAGLAYLAAFTLVTIFATVKIYNSDILLTGIGNTKGAKMFKAVVLKKR